ncbi:MAG: YbjQ family protein [Candidatus Thermoplasmatota archaeon]|nr:YbjQ family protein [Candidatus Thermoplasmatota archaeon]MBU1941470.1 YbjQ family protein [Candidatus Thermoplasmatota archaeon]
MIIVNTDFVLGKEITKMFGLVRGNTVQAKSIGKDIKAGLRNIAGGEITEYTDMLAEAREIALKRMEEKAEKLGADAVINVRFMTSSIMGGAAEILAYGTAVNLKL